MKNSWKLLTATHLAAGLAGYVAAPTEPLDREVRQAGLFTTDTRRVLAATVNSLRAESRLLVYSYRGSAAVSVERSVLWLLGGQHELMVPATVGYYVDLSALTLDRVRYDARSQVVTVALPPLVMGDVAFQSEAARTVNGGVLTWSQAQVDELGRQAYATARRAFVAQAQSPALAEVARREAGTNVARLFELPLRAAGQPHVRVVATFERR